MRHGKGCECDPCFAGRRIRKMLDAAWVRELTDEERIVAEGHIIYGAHDEDYVSDEKIQAKAMREIESMRRVDEEDEPHHSVDPIAVEARQ